MSCTLSAVYAGAFAPRMNLVRYNPPHSICQREGDTMTSEPTIVTGTPESRSVATRDEMVAFFKRRQEAYENLDAALLASDYADRATIESPTGGVHIGPEAAERTLKMVFHGFLDITLTVEDLIIDGNHAVEVLSVEGTHIGEYLGLAPTGKRFKMPMVVFYELAEGRIIRERRIYDFTGMLIQIGVLKAKPA